jgi:integrase
LPFVGTKIERGKSVITWLEEKTDLKKIEDKQFESERLQKTKDVFLFQCYTGLAYTDMAALKKGDYQQTPDKQWYIKGVRQKTNRDYYCVLINDAVNILKKYDFELPVISYQKYNQYIKEVCSLSGIEIKASTHLARRTCACNLLNGGVDIETVAKMLGDTPEMIRNHYAVLFDQTVIKEVGKYDSERFKRQIDEILGLEDK